jgi:hypothetical protein
MRSNLWVIMVALGLAACASSKANGGAATEPLVNQPEATQGDEIAGQKQGKQCPMMQGDKAEMCPMMVEGTTARARDVEGGVAIVFTTTGDVAELRQRVGRMAMMHNKKHGQPGQSGQMEMHGSHHGGGPAADEGSDSQGMDGSMMGDETKMMCESKMPPSTARSEEIKGGARLVLTPKDKADLAALRKSVHEHAEKMNSGQCPMMSEDAPGSRAD